MSRHLFYKKMVMVNVLYSLLQNTLGQKSLLRAVSVCTKTTLISGSVGGAVGVSHTSKLKTYLSCPLALSMPTYSNF